MNRLKFINRFICCSHKMRMSIHWSKRIFILWMALVGGICSAAVTKELRCEYLNNPLGIDATAPRLSWIITSNQRGEMQTAYQILVASSPKLLSSDKGDLWDSGKVSSDESS